MIGGSSYQREDWKKARKKNFRNWVPRWDIHSIIKRVGEYYPKGVTSIYFSEFPDDSKAADFFDLFGCVGKVIEVAISPRRNNVSKRFGFARFVEVEDARLLAVHLDNVQILGRKIHVNLPRFERKRKTELFRTGGVENHGAVANRKEFYRSNKVDFGFREEIDHMLK
ncbi:unnamed protein product [Vicia faba]|uniref:RRM domain-containing protein n=1 Tax=Vicia faba TaxID=3906 RepID=A0AAV1A0Y2_VICFA|nr:unnamed protein product [Vicia faba]